MAVTRKTINLNSFLNEYFDTVSVLVVAVIFMVAFLFVIQPKFNRTLNAIKDNINQQQKVYFDQRSRLESLKSAAVLYEKIKSSNLSDVRKVNEILPEDYPKEKLFGEFEEIIVKNGFILSSISVSREDIKKEGGTGYKTAFGRALPNNIGRFYVNLSVGAIDYAGLKNLLAAFEANSRLIDVANLTFSPEAKTAQIQFYTYYFQPGS